MGSPTTRPPTRAERLRAWWPVVGNVAFAACCLYAFANAARDLYRLDPAMHGIAGAAIVLGVWAGAFASGFIQAALGIHRDHGCEHDLTVEIAWDPDGVPISVRVIDQKTQEKYPCQMAVRTR